jgi:hypothetical protein
MIVPKLGTFAILPTVIAHGLGYKICLEGFSLPAS